VCVCVYKRKRETNRETEVNLDAHSHLKTSRVSEVFPFLWIGVTLVKKSLVQ
jgi:hypothetical protein